MTLAELLSLPVPMAGPGQPAAACVVLTEAGWSLAWMTGIHKVPFGPLFPNAKAAAAMCERVNKRGYE